MTVTCPRCDDLCHDDRPTCVCGARLFPTAGDFVDARNVSGPPQPLCPNDRADLDEWGFCSVCGYQDVPAVTARLARSRRERASKSEED